MKEEDGRPISHIPPVKRSRLDTLTALSQALVRELCALESEESSPLKGIDLAMELETYEKQLIRSALMRTGGRQCQAARFLNVKVTTLHAKIKRYRILERTQIIF